MFWRARKKQAVETKAILHLQGLMADLGSRVTELQEQIDIVADQCGTNEAVLHAHLNAPVNPAEDDIFEGHDTFEVPVVSTDDIR